MVTPIGGTGRKSGSSHGNGSSADDQHTGVDGTTTDLTDPIADGHTDGVSGGPGIFDPASLGGSGATGATQTEGQPVKRGRGRPKGSGAGKSGGSKPAGKAGASKSTADFIASTLFSVHLMGASMLNISELAISDSEAKQLADAIAEVSEHYDVPLMDPKTAAWGKLLLAVGTVYGTRVASMVMTNKAKQAKVTAFPPNGGRPVAVNQ